METLHVYADESCKNGHRYLAIGCIAVEEAHLNDCQAALVAARQGNTSEVKWSDMRASKVPFYRRFASVFFEMAKADKMHFHSLVHDTTTDDHPKYSEGSSDIGFDKVVYQLLLHKVGKKYGKNYRIEVYLDERKAEQPPEVLRPMLNQGLRKKYGITTDPFRVIRFMNSKDSDVIQLSDLIVGAIGTRKNGLHQRHDAARCKVELGDFIAKSARDLEWPFKIDGWFARRFTLWHFQYGAGKKAGGGS